jgi:ubiquitin-like 1-activating enzyme E1 B
VEEIENLQREARALKEIRQSMGSAEFAQKVFDKVFKEDINRLRGMEDMWTSRKAPEPLDFKELEETLSTVEPEVSSKDQRVWTVSENLAVFRDSLDRLSKRLKALQSEESGSPAVLVFDKDDVDTLDFVTASANLRANIFGIEAKSKFDTKRTFILVS